MIEYKRFLKNTGLSLAFISAAVAFDHFYFGPNFFPKEEALNHISTKTDYRSMSGGHDMAFLSDGCDSYLYGYTREFTVAKENGQEETLAVCKSLINGRTMHRVL